MEFVQDLLTAATQIIAIAGLGGIAVHAIYTYHTRWMRTYCPAIASHTPDTQAKETEASSTLAPTPQPEPPAIEDAWETPIATSPARYWVREALAAQPTLCLPAAIEETKPTFPTFQGYSEARLRKIAKEMKIKRYSVLNRAQLMTAIGKHPAAIKFA